MEAILIYTAYGPVVRMSDGAEFTIEPRRVATPFRQRVALAWAVSWWTERLAWHASRDSVPA